MSGGIVDGIYIAAALAVPFLSGVVVGRQTKRDPDSYLENLGRMLNNIVGSIRSDARFTGAGCCIRNVSELTVRNDTAPYTMTIERKEAA